ncbi:MAG: pilus assembly protein PilZ [Spirochaetaceae bacterium]|nr:pilus assembly protein PilZ [Spirochaetaceae bacterium]
MDIIENMETLPRVKINEYYEQFKPVPVTFTKEVIQVTGLLTKMVNLKCGSDFFPCVIYTTSFEMAKIVANNKSGIIDKLKQFNNVASLRFCFKIPSTEEQVAFLVPARVTNTQMYGDSADMSLFNLQYSQRPPDDLIEIMGRILDANYRYAKRGEERFLVNADAIRKMRFMGNEIGMVMDNAVHRCILRDIGFRGARFFVKGVAEQFENKPCSVRFDFDEPRESYTINGKLLGAEKAEGHPEMAVLTMLYDDHVPMSYKTRLSSYVSTVRISPVKPQAVAPPAPKSAEPNGEAECADPAKTEGTVPPVADTTKSVSGNAASVK